jgi:hypothetical protein
MVNTIRSGAQWTGWRKANGLSGIWGTTGRWLAGTCLLVFAFTMCMTGVASADVGPVGGLDRMSPGLRTLLSEVERLATSANGDYKCSSEYRDSDVQNGPLGFVLGNCAAGPEIEVVSVSGGAFNLTRGAEVCRSANRRLGCDMGHTA